MVRNPRTAMRKDAMHLTPSAADYLNCGWLEAVGRGGLSTHAGVPVLQEHYQRFVRTARRWQARLTLTARQQRRYDDQTRVLEDGSVKWFKGDMDLRYTDVNWYTRVSFYHAFGIPPHEQQAIEQGLARTDLPVTLGTHFTPHFYWEHS